MLSGEYFSPPNGAQRAPAMLLLHGCGGLWSRPGVLTARHARMASLLQELGYGVLLLDSFGSRGLREQCTVPASERRVNVAQRVDDAQRAINWLKMRREIDANRVGALGWSNGATVLLNLVGREKPGIKAAVAFYPGCESLARRSRYTPAVPTLILIGEADDWTPAQACQRLAEKAGNDTFHLVTYPDTYHDFDIPGSGVRVRKDVPAAVDPVYGVTIAPNQTATDDAYRRTFKWIGRWMDPDRFKPSRNDYNPVLRLQ
ncbi:dienelactone hydrolase [Jeongeupia sp. HS-3]|nr:dienelactone hydrolase [Jeongeupia sp. HS-3]